MATHSKTIQLATIIIVLMIVCSATLLMLGLALIEEPRIATLLPRISQEVTSTTINTIPTTITTTLTATTIITSTFTQPQVRSTLTRTSTTTVGAGQIVTTTLKQPPQTSTVTQPPVTITVTTTVTATQPQNQSLSIVSADANINATYTPDGALILVLSNGGTAGVIISSVDGGALGQHAYVSADCIEGCMIGTTQIPENSEATFVWDLGSEAPAVNMVAGSTYIFKIKGDGSTLTVVATAHG